MVPFPSVPRPSGVGEQAWRRRVQLGALISADPAAEGRGRQTIFGPEGARKMRGGDESAGIGDAADRICRIEELIARRIQADAAIACSRARPGPVVQSLPRRNWFAA